jgi:hypothetical protein
MSRAQIAAALAVVLAGVALAARWHGDAAIEGDADVVVTCTACHDASFVVVPATAPASGRRAAR